MQRLGRAVSYRACATRLEESIFLTPLLSFSFFLCRYISSTQRFFQIAALLQPPTTRHTYNSSAAGADAGVDAGADAGAGAGDKSLKTGVWKSVDGRRVPPVRSCLLVESDNLLYTDTSHILPYLKKFYSNLAGVVQNNIHFTASIFWVAKYSAIKHLTDFILEIYTSSNEFLAYTTYISQFISKRVNHGHPPLNAEGRGIPLYAVNEMTLLHYYHHLYIDGEDELKRPLLQSLPLFVTKDGINAQKRHGNWKAYVGLPVSQKREQADLDTQGTDKDTGTDTDTNIYSVKSTRQDTSATRSVLFLNHTHAASEGDHAVVGAEVAHGAFDPGSWGQYLGGTYSLHRAPGFIDLSHIIGKAMVKSACAVQIKCVCMKQEPDGAERRAGRGGKAGSFVNKTGHNVKRNSDTDKNIGNGIGIGIHTDAFTGTKPSQQDLHMHTVTRRAQHYVKWAPNRVQPSTSTSRQSSSPAENLPFHLLLQNITYDSNGNGFTGPFIRCCAGDFGNRHGQDASCGEWGRVWNLHVHSKNTLPFLSKKCNCS